LIRIFILADTVTKARDLSQLFSDDDRFEVIGASTPSRSNNQRAAFAGVILAASIPPAQLPSEGAIVYLTELHEPANFSTLVKGWLPPDASATEILAAVFAAASNLCVLTPAQARRWLPSSGSRAAEGIAAESLTARELEVLRLLASGDANKQIAAKLRMSEHTAKFHVAQILAKLGAVSRTEAVTTAIRRGLIPL
jgi:DNA-binding NarL/FixJ family response regulator